MLGVFFLLLTNIGFSASHFSRFFFYIRKDIVFLSSNLKRYLNCDLFCLKVANLANKDKIVAFLMRKRD